MSDSPDILISIRDLEPSILISCEETTPEIQIKIDESGTPSYPIYDGDTTVIPKAFEEQVLETKNHVLLDDITVEEIPYSEVSNPSGGYTVSIAS